MGCGNAQKNAARSGLFVHRSVRRVREHLFPFSSKPRQCGVWRTGCPSPLTPSREVVVLTHMYQLAEASPTAPVPPQNLDAEESVLGAMMLSPGAIGAVSEVLSASDFYRASHGVIYRAALDLYAKGEPVDAITLCDELER